MILPSDTAKLTPTNAARPALPIALGFYVLKYTASYKHWLALQYKPCQMGSLPQQSIMHVMSFDGSDEDV